jgi:hypothetical protein
MPENSGREIRKEEEEEEQIMKGFLYAIYRQID